MLNFLYFWDQMNTRNFVHIFTCFLVGAFVVSCHFNTIENDFTQSEKEWIGKRKGSIIVAPEKNYPPFAFIDEQGFFRGISADYLKEIEKNLGIQFVIAPSFHLAKNLELIKNKEIDVITSLTPTNKRSDFMDFSDPYIQVPTVIVTSDSIDRTLDLSDMEGMKIAVGLDYGVHEYLIDKDISLHLYPQYNDLICLEKLSEGKVDAAIADIASVSYLIKKNNFSNLKISGQTDFKYSLCMATRKDEPFLSSSINKAIRKIDVSKKEEINKKWGTLQPPLTKTQQLSYLFFPLGIFLILLVGVSVFINRRKLIRFLK